MGFRSWIKQVFDKLFGISNEENYVIGAEIQIKKTTMRHIMAIHAIEKESFSDPWPLTSLKDEITHPESICLVATNSKKRVLGHIMMRLVLDEGHIHNISVAQHARRQGIGYRILEAAISKASNQGIKSITLEARSQNHAAISLYEKLGFVTCGVRKNYYHTPTDDALVMVRKANAKSLQHKD